MIDAQCEALQPVTRLRDELQVLRSRYDSGAVSESTYAVIK